MPSRKRQASGQGPASPKKARTGKRQPSPKPEPITSDAQQLPPPDEQQHKQKLSTSDGLYLITPEEELAAKQELTASTDLMERYSLADFETQLQSCALSEDFVHFLAPPLASLARGKWRMMQHDKAEFDTLLSIAPVGRPMQHFPLQTMRRAFLMRRREGAAAVAAEAAPPITAPPAAGRPAAARKLRRTMFSRGPSELGQEEVTELLASVHQRLCRASFGKAWGNPFALVITPETCAQLGVPNYFTFIKEPMNLTWMKDKVKEGAYPTAAAYAADIELIRSNAQTYNRPTDPVYGFADDLRALCAQELLKRGYDMGPPVPRHSAATPMMY